jgi:hypothetical protein
MVEAQNNRSLITCPLRCDQRTILREGSFFKNTICGNILGGIFTLPLDRFKMSIIETLSEVNIHFYVTLKTCLCSRQLMRIYAQCTMKESSIFAAIATSWSAPNAFSTVIWDTRAQNLKKLWQKIWEWSSRRFWKVFRTTKLLTECYKFVLFNFLIRNKWFEGVKTRKTTNVLRKSKLEEEGAILEEKLEAINEELENVENELERDGNLTDTISTNLKEFVRSSEKALKGF